MEQLAALQPYTEALESTLRQAREGNFSTAMRVFAYCLDILAAHPLDIDSFIADGKMIQAFVRLAQFGLNNKLISESEYSFYTTNTLRPSFVTALLTQLLKEVIDRKETYIGGFRVNFVTWWYDSYTQRLGNYNGALVPLAPVVNDFLYILVQRPNQVVSFSELSPTRSTSQQEKSRIRESIRRLDHVLQSIGSVSIRPVKGAGFMLVTEEHKILPIGFRD